MPAHTLTAVFNRELTVAEIEELYEAGCNDAAFGIQAGVQYAEFDRDAADEEAAMESITAQIQAAGMPLGYVTTATAGEGQLLAPEILAQVEEALKHPESRVKMGRPQRKV